MQRFHGAHIREREPFRPEVDLQVRTGYGGRPAVPAEANGTIWATRASYGAMASSSSRKACRRARLVDRSKTFARLANVIPGGASTATICSQSLSLKEAFASFLAGSRRVSCRWQALNATARSQAWIFALVGGYCGTSASCSGLGHKSRLEIISMPPDLEFLMSLMIHYSGSMQLDKE